MIIYKRDLTSPTKYYSKYFLNIHTKKEKANFSRVYI